MEDTNIASLAAEKRFTDFSTAVKNELKNKLSQDSRIQNYVSEFDKIQQMKNLFAQVSKTAQSDI